MNILIAESGSTKTDWRLILANGAVQQLATQGINPFYQSGEDILNILQAELLSKINQKIDKIYYYGTGVTNREKVDILKKVLFQLFEATTIAVYDDMLAAARALCLNKKGIACILGTGANSCLYDGEKIIDKVAPLGFWLGDEGSGGYLGKVLIIKYLRKELPENIQQKFEKKFGVLERTFLLNKAYNEPLPNRYFASFSKFLFDNRADQYIWRLCYDSFVLFLENNVLKYPDYQNYPVHFTGSVAFYYSDILKKAAQSLGLTVGVIMESPIAGLTLFHKNTD